MSSARGSLLANAEIEVHGIVFTVRGLEVRRAQDGTPRIDAPRIWHGGKSMRAVELPLDLERAIRQEVIGLLASFPSDDGPT